MILGKPNTVANDPKANEDDVGNIDTPGNSPSRILNPIVPLPPVIIHVHVQLHGTFVRGHVQETIDLNMSLEDVIIVLEKHAMKKAKISRNQASDLEFTFGTRYIAAPKNVSTTVRKKNTPPVDVDGFADFETEGNLTALVGTIRDCKTGGMVLQVLATVERAPNDDGENGNATVAPVQGGDVGSGREVISIRHF